MKILVRKKYSQLEQGRFQSYKFDQNKVANIHFIDRNKIGTYMSRYFPGVGIDTTYVCVRVCSFLPLPVVTVGDAGISWNPSEFKVLDKSGGFDGKLEKFYDLIMICSAVWNNDLDSVIAFRPPPAIDKTFPSDPHFCNNGLMSVDSKSNNIF